MMQSAMDLSGRGGPAYRTNTLRCPGCGEVMRPELVPMAEVDVCDQCGGLWIDWFDGDIHTLATQAEAARVDRGTPPPGMMRPAAGPMRDAAGVDPTTTGGARPTNACPRCMQMLVPEMYRFADAVEAAKEDDLTVTGVELLRCTDCAGSFVPRPSAHLLLDRIREPRTATLWEALVAMLKSLVKGPNLKVED